MPTFASVHIKAGSGVKHLLGDGISDTFAVGAATKNWGIREFPVWEGKSPSSHNC